METERLREIPIVSLKRQVYDELKRKILACEYSPGTMLTEEGICETLQASRTPVRDALGRLEQEQLVSILPKKGVKVNQVSLSNVNELFEVRLLMEPYAVLRYGNRIADSVYAEYVQAFRNPLKDKITLYQKDDEFHKMFIEATGNQYLKVFYNMVEDQVMRYRVLSDIANRTTESITEHLDIAMNCLRGDWERASGAMRAHIENAKISMIDFAVQENLDSQNIFSFKFKPTSF